MTFRQQIEEAPKYDYQFQLDNLDKQTIMNSYEEQYKISQETFIANEELIEENKRLKTLVEDLEISILVQDIKLPYALHADIDDILKK